MPARKGNADADDERQEGSSKEEATDAVTLVPQSNALPVVDEAPTNDRLHDRLPDGDMITAASQLSQVPDSQDETHPHDDDDGDDDDDDDDDIRTGSDVDSLFGKPLAG